MELPHPSVVHAFRAVVAEHPGVTAIVSGERRLTYAELGRMVFGLAERLTRVGVAGESVAIAMPTSIDAVVSVLAALAAGARAAPVNPYFTPPELSAALREIAPRVAICGVEASVKLAALRSSVGIESLLCFGGPGDEGLSLDAWVGGEPLRSGCVIDVAEDAPALLIFTGGTTGEPKAVVHSHRSLFVSVLQHCKVWPVQRGSERFLSAAPIFHIWGLSYATLVPMCSGGTLVIVPKYDPEAILGAIERERITVFGGGPAPVYMGLTRSPRYATTNFASLKYCLSGGAPCPEELHREWERHTGCPLLEGWGMSEGAPLCLNRPGARKLLSVGRAVAETEVQVVDLESGTRLISEGEAGEVRVRGPQIMLGYLGRPGATREVLRDGWLYTGDIGYLDREGDLFLVDRKKDMIIVGGYNVYPRQVDELLFKHPAIAEAGTVGQPDARLGEVLVAFVVLKPDVTLTEAELFEYCRANLVKYKRPVAVHFLDQLPRTNAKKIDKKALRGLLEPGVRARAEVSPS
jgi:long-chain acyl-CoA synthetase